MEFSYDRDSKERLPYEHYLKRFQEADPETICLRTGLPFDRDGLIFTVRLLGVSYRVRYPDFFVSHEPEDAVGYYPLEDAVNARILVLRYLVEGVCAPSSGKFLTYREMPWGNVYLRQFTGRCILRLAYGFGNRPEDLAGVCARIGGKRLAGGDVSCEIPFLEDFRLRLILWAGDEEFAPSSQILFSDNFPAAFQAEDMAVVGDILITALKALDRAK